MQIYKYYFKVVSFQTTFVLFQIWIRLIIIVILHCD
jgi:hypothetical protein